MISDEKFTASRELMEQAYNYLRDGYEQALNALEEAETENAKLRKELADTPKCETCEAMLDCDECLRADGSHKERRRLSAENAKLRELAQRADRLLTDLFSHIDYSRCTALEAVATWRVRARELGVEVDE